MSYKSPIEVITERVTLRMEDDIVKAVQKYDISVNKTELQKALMYDRKQYTQGFEDGKKYAEAESIRHGHWINVNGDGSLWRCSACGETQCCDSNYCGECGAKMDLPEPIIYPQVEGITPTVVKMDEVEE